MTLEADIFTALKDLVSGRVYPDLAAAGAARPYIVYQQVGGVAWNFLEATPVGKRNARMQVACWSTTRAASKALAMAAEEALINSQALRAYVLGAVISDYDAETNLYGTRQDFSLNY